MPDVNYDTFTPDELMPLIPSLFVPGTFLQRMFFPTPYEFDTAEVYFDRVIDDKRMAPLVAPLAPGRIQQPKGYRKETLIPASIKPKNQVNPREVLARLPGEAIGGEMSATDRAAAIREKYLNDHQTKIARRLEWMASSIIRTGAVTLVGEDYPSTVVDFARLNTLTKGLTLGARWGEANVSPYSDVDGWLNEVGAASGSAGDVVIMDRKAWALFIADPAAKNAIDTTLGQTAAISLGFTPTTPGAPAFKGRDGNVEFYVYNDNYEDDDGNAAQLLPDYTVIVASRGGVEGGKLLGVVQHAENNYERGEFFPHNWVDPNTGAEWIETITAPILAPKRINATLCATVR